MLSLFLTSFTRIYLLTSRLFHLLEANVLISTMYLCFLFLSSPRLLTRQPYIPHLHTRVSAVLLFHFDEANFQASSLHLVRLPVTACPDHQFGKHGGHEGRYILPDKVASLPLTCSSLGPARQYFQLCENSVFARRSRENAGFDRCRLRGHG